MHEEPCFRDMMVPAAMDSGLSRVKVLGRQREAHIAELMLSGLGADSLAMRMIWKRRDPLGWHNTLSIGLSIIESQGSRLWNCWQLSA
jgi:hypothetical protein